MSLADQNVVWKDHRVIAGMNLQMARRRTALDAGAGHLGWRVGLGGPASLDMMETSGPLVGFLTDSTLIDSGATVSISNWTKAVIEFEIAAYLGSDLTAGCTAQEARAAISAIGPAIELADIDALIEAPGLTELLERDLFHRAVVLESPDRTRAGLVISGLTAQIYADGNQTGSVVQLEALTGPYPGVIATVANTLAEFGETLRAGDVVITGSVISPMPMNPEVEYTFQLEPFDAISIFIA